MLREFMKRLFNRQDKTTKVVNQIDEVYKKSLEDDEIKDAEQSAAQKVIEYVRKNPENAIEILKGILEKDEIPNKVFEKAATEISEIDDIPDKVIPKAVADSEVNVSDKIIENIIENGSVNRPEKIELINNIDDEELKQKKVEEELKQIYQNCEKTSELELVHKLETIRIVQKNPIIEKLEEMIVAKRMALNYRDFGGTKISTLARYLPVDKMIEVNIPEMVCNEYEKIKEEEKNKVDKSSLKTQILQEIAKKVANSYQEVGEFVIPQSRNMTQLTRKEEENFIKSIQTYVRKKLRATDITSIRDQIRGRDTNMLLKQYIEKMLELGDCSPKDLGANIALLTRYMYQEKYTQKEIYNGIEEFASKVDSDFDINNWYSFIDKCIGKAKKRDLLNIDYIPITQKELDTIKEIKNPARERLAFTLLVIAKFNNLKSETNNNWINYSMDVYFNLARVTCQVDDRPYIIYDLKELGLVEVSKKITRFNIRITFVDNESDPVLKITDMRELGYQYQNLGPKSKIKLCKRCGKPYKVKYSKGGSPYCTDCQNKSAKDQTKLITCDCCGKEFIAVSKNNRSVLCSECQNIIDLEKTRQRVAKHREKRHM